MVLHQEFCAILFAHCILWKPFPCSTVTVVLTSNSHNSHELWWAQGTYGCQHEGGPRRPQRQKYPDCAQHLGWHPAPLHSGTCSWWCLKTRTSTSKFTATVALHKCTCNWSSIRICSSTQNVVVVCFSVVLFSTMWFCMSERLFKACFWISTKVVYFTVLAWLVPHETAAILQLEIC